MPRSATTRIFFDLDDTLYPPETGLWNEIALRINRYLIERVGIPAAEVEPLRRRYFTTYGTTFNGLRREHRIDPQDYFLFVHDIPLAERLAPDPRLRWILEGIPQKKFIFSNADRAYILRVLSRLNIADLFDGIIDVFATRFLCKPTEGAYPAALRMAGSTSAEGCMLVDDLVRNLLPARTQGWKTVLVHHRGPDGSADHQIDTLYDLPGVLG
jgi:putative hydrolase of the HAD superfamily